MPNGRYFSGLLSRLISGQLLWFSLSATPVGTSLIYLTQIPINDASQTRRGNLVIEVQARSADKKKSGRTQVRAHELATFAEVSI